MQLKITAQVHRKGKRFIAFCPEFPEANGQGETVEACVQSLRDAIDLLLEDRRGQDDLGAMQGREETPPGVRAKLTEALAGKFVPGDRANIERIMASLE